MARTVLARTTPVPTDRDITVVIEQAIPRVPPLAVGGDAARAASEMMRHMSVTSQRSHVDAGVSSFLTLVGRANRPWTRAELEGQMRYLRIPFESISISHDTAAPRRSGLLSSAARAIPGIGPAVGAGLDSAAGAADGLLGEEPPMEMNRTPLIAGIAAIVVGLGILVAIMVWGGK